MNDENENNESRTDWAEAIENVLVIGLLLAFVAFVVWVNK